ALLQIFGSPRNVELVDGDASALGVDSGAEHFGGTEEDADFAFVHVLNHCSTRLFSLAFLNETYLICRYAIILHQFPLDFAVSIPLTGFICTEIAENELCAFVLVILLVVLAYQGGTMASFVIYVVIVFILVDKAHVKGH